MKLFLFFATIRHHTSYYIYWYARNRCIY